MSKVLEIAKKAKEAVGLLSHLSPAEKNGALLSIAKELLRHKDEILAANKRDLEAARAEVQAGKMLESLYSRLKLDEPKFQEMVSGVEQVAALADPLGKISLATEMDKGLELYRVSCPIGVVGVIFEARPDVLVQIASLGLKSGNAVLLKGGKEAEQTNRVLFDVLHKAAVDAGVPKDALALLESREDVTELLKAVHDVDLIVPRGSNALVSYIQHSTTIPVLGHADGICHVYIDERADVKKGVEVAIDSKAQYPAACNAAETILVHRKIAGEFLPPIMKALQERKVEVRCDEKTIQEFKLTGAKKATEEDWKTEYLDLIVSLKVVDSLDEAIRHINTYGSHHTESMVTEDTAAFNRFFAEVDSAGVFLNASTRFADGFRYGFGAEVGISTGKLHPRGPVGLEGLVTYKYKIVGQGHTVSMYSGANPKKFIHRQMRKDEGEMK